MGHRECSWGVSSTCAGRDVLLPVPHTASHRQESMPQAHQRLACTCCASLHCGACFPCLVVGGGVLMRPCMPRMPSKWRWRGKTQQLMEETMRLGSEILFLPAWLQCETPRLPAGLLVHPSPGLSKVLMLLSVREQEQGHSKENVRITHLGELSKQCQMLWH